MSFKTKSAKYLLGVEFIILFFGVPLLLIVDRTIIHPSAVLIPILIGLVVYFRKQKNFRLADLFRLNVTPQTWRYQFLLLGITASLLTLYVFVFEPHNLFNLPKRNPQIWMTMLLFYPVFSAYGQEIIYRKFLFMRYRQLFKKPNHLILASALTFSFAHIVYFSVLSIVLTFIAGLYFGIIYRRTSSVLFVSIMHGLMGLLIFTVGLGQHFWIDMLSKI